MIGMGWDVLNRVAWEDIRWVWMCILCICVLVYLGEWVMGCRGLVCNHTRVVQGRGAHVLLQPDGSPVSYVHIIHRDPASDWHLALHPQQLRIIS